MFPPPQIDFDKSFLLEIEMTQIQVNQFETELVPLSQIACLASLIRLKKKKAYILFHQDYMDKVII